MTQIYSSLAELSKSGQSAVLCIVMKSQGSTPRKAGSKMLVNSDGKIEGSVGGGKIEYLVIEQALELMRAETPLIKDYDLGGDLGMQCGGKMTIYFEPINSVPRLLIFGAGHIGKVLAKMALNYRFQVVLIDNREEVFQQKEEGITYILDSFPQAYQNLEYREDDYIVITTYKHTYDEEIAAWVLPQPHAYLGMMASKRKAALARKKWAERGIDQRLIDQVFSPIGLSMQCETPEEIALSVMSQLVDELNKSSKK
jgi:xanthine dehydrogenase accessory factor